MGLVINIWTRSFPVSIPKLSTFHSSNHHWAENLYIICAVQVLIELYRLPRGISETDFSQVSKVHGVFLFFTLLLDPEVTQILNWELLLPSQSYCCVCNLLVFKQEKAELNQMVKKY